MSNPEISQRSHRLDINELRERREREWRERVLAVIAEFGGQRRQPLLVPEDDPCNDATLLRLAGEVLFLRDQLQRNRHRCGMGTSR